MQSFLPHHRFCNTTSYIRLSSCNSVHQCFSSMPFYIRIDTFYAHANITLLSPFSLFLQLATMQQLSHRKVCLADLKQGPTAETICVRVMRKWLYDNTQSGGYVRYIGLVLADEKVYSLVFWPHRAHHICIKIPCIIHQIKIKIGPNRLTIMCTMICRVIPCMPTYRQNRLKRKILY
jgi:hypothetical protein